MAKAVEINRLPLGRLKLENGLTDFDEIYCWRQSTIDWLLLIQNPGRAEKHLSGRLIMIDFNTRLYSRKLETRLSGLPINLNLCEHEFTNLIKYMYVRIDI